MAQTFDIFLIVMALLALVVFAALHFFEAGYGYLFNPKYGPPVPNKIGWVLMESPVFVAMCVLWLLLGKDVGSRAADALRALSGPLPATGVHLSAADARRVAKCRSASS